MLKNILKISVMMHNISSELNINIF